MALSQRSRACNNAWVPAHAPFDAVLAAARVNARWAWEQLVREYSPRLLGYFRSQRVPDPEDLVGAVFVHVVRDLHTFTGGQDDFAAWVFRIAQNRLVDARRKSSRMPEDTASQPPEVAVEDVADIALRRADEERLYRLLAVLPSEQRAVIYMRFVLDMSHADIAAALGKQPGAVKMLQQRAVATLGARLAPSSG